MNQKKQWVILLRHGIAETPGSVPDEERALTRKGLRRMRASSRGLVHLLPSINAVASSPLRRCVETAHLVAERAQIAEVALIDELRPQAEPEAFLHFLRETKSAAIVCVGHEPLLSKIAASLLGAQGDHDLELRKGGCYVFTMADGVSHLEWVLAPRVLRAVR